MSFHDDSTPSQSKKVFAGLGLGAIAAIILVLVVLGGIGGVVIYRASQQPSIQVTAVNIPQGTANPQSWTPVNYGRVISSLSFDYSTSAPGNYSLVFNNSLSAAISKSISVSYSAAGTSGAKSFAMNPSESQTLSFTLKTGDRLFGSFNVTGGGNDINFYITGQTCYQVINFYFTLVNSGSASGYASVEFLVDGQEKFHNGFLVAAGQHISEGGSVGIADCGSHNYAVVLVGVDKA